MRLDALAREPLVRRAALRRPGYDLRALHSDSRRVNGDTGFFALRGFTTDGHAYLEQVRAAGAPVVFVSDPAAFDRLAGKDGAGTADPSLAGVFLVPPGRRPLAELAAAVHGHPARELTLLGVTGTNGKTTVIHLCMHLLGALGGACGLLGTMGRCIGGEWEEGARTTPEAPEIHAFLRRCVEQGVSTVAMEVSSHGIALERSHGLPFRAAAFTNLTQDHLDYHDTMEGYREAKFRLFMEYALEQAVIHTGDPAGVELAGRMARERPAVPVLAYGLEQDGSPGPLTVRRVTDDAAGSRGLLCLGGREAPFSLPLPGRFNLENFLAAAGLVLACGHGLEAVAGAAAHCRGAPGRFERLALDAPFTVVVDYAHTPGALESLLRAARPLTRGRLRVLFGCGGGRDREKRPRMGAVAAALADRVILTDDNPRDEDSPHILKQIEAGMADGASRVTIPDRKEAIFALLDEAGEGDMLLLAGKGSETYQEIGGVRHPFRDRQVVAEWARARGIAMEHGENGA